jgi:ferrochelatase
MFLRLYDSAGAIGAAPMSDPKAPRTRGVMLINVGTPDEPTPPAVRRYLAEFLGDPDVIQLPWWMRWAHPWLAGMIARNRAAESAEKYESIWTDRGSPLRVIMQDQASELSKLLPKDIAMFEAMRYGSPSIADSLKAAADAGVEDLIAVPMYPHFSQTTTGTVVQELYRALKVVAPHINLTVRTSWYDDVGYINAQARCIANFARQHDLRPENAVLWFSAHGLPVSYIRRGDPYERHINATIKLVTERLGWDERRTTLAYQSRLGPMKWLEPYAEDMLEQLAEAGEKKVLVVPISFVADCLETLEEIALRYREDFETDGRQLYVCPALNTDEHWITALKNLILRGPRPVSGWNEDQTPLLAPQRADAKPAVSHDRLVMVGASLPGRLGPGSGPELQHVDEATFASVKRTNEETAELLRELGQDSMVSEALIWNTCHRYELYAWLNQESDITVGCGVNALRKRLVRSEDVEGAVNVLIGQAAWRHLTRTAAGLNSGLPGDQDVVTQLKSAYQTAERAGVAGQQLDNLLREAERLSEALRSETQWGEVAPGYCFAALTQLIDELPQGLANRQHVVIGGSATSRSILQTLFERFAVPERNATLVYRAHQGGQMKVLRRAIGNGRRLRTDSYSAPPVLSAIGAADVVYLGIDRAEPVLNREHLVGLRDFEATPLWIVDFNSKGSTADLDRIPGVRLFAAERLDEAVRAYADELCGLEHFSSVVQQAEAWLLARTEVGGEQGMDLPCVREGTLVNPSCQQCVGRQSETEAAKAST